MKNQPPQSTSDLLKKALIELKKSRLKIDGLKKTQHEPVAVVGMGCRLPGGVDSPTKLWSLLEEGRNAITPMKDERWDAEEYFDLDPEAPGKIYTKSVGLVDNVDQFDPEFFSISPAEARLMEPQQRLLLECAWNALEHAGIAPASLYGSKTGVFVGICHQGYAHLKAKYSDIESTSPYDGTGNAHAIASGRISYLLGLQGPSISLDTACSSSLVTFHLACQSLRSGESNVALAGGVNLILEPSTSIIFAKAGMLSPDGQCKTFDADANGYVRGEGCGIVVLKRLSDALKDKDQILAVIKGSAVNQDGKSQGITAPNEFAQETVLKAALQDAGVSPDDVSYIEAHGTGTPLGDPIELSAINTVYGGNREPDDKILVGSIKTNIGHLEAAAGVAGLMKVVLSMHHKTIPAHLHFKKPNNYIDWDSMPLAVPTNTQDWNTVDAKTTSRLAGLSSFGFSGTNCHIILQEAPAEEIPEHNSVDESEDNTTESAFTPVLLNLSTKKEEALDELVNHYQHFLETTSKDLKPEHANSKQAKPEISWSDICYTANVGRNHFRHRLSIIADNQAHALNLLQQYKEGKTTDNILKGEAPKSAVKIGFLFTGQGAQYAGMGRALFSSNTIFRKALENCAELMSSHLEFPLLSLLWGDHSDKINDTQFTQPALFALQYALSKMWQAYGIEPSCVTGHSIGEYAAACLAGVFSLKEAVLLICARGRLMASLCSTGGMLIVFAPAKKVAQKIEESDYKLSIAAINSPQHCVVSGESHFIDQFEASLEDESCQSKRLAVSHAFHSYMMEPMLEEFRTLVETIQLKAPRITYISSKTGNAVSNELKDPRYWVDHIAQPVQFAKAAQTIATQKVSGFLEIGPGINLTKLAPLSIKNESEFEWLASLDQQADDNRHVTSIISRLYILGSTIKWDQVHPVKGTRVTNLPTYPYQTQGYWIDDIRLGNYSKQTSADYQKLLYLTEWKKRTLLPKQNDNNREIILVGDHPSFAPQLLTHKSVSENTEHQTINQDQTNTQHQTRTRNKTSTRNKTTTEFASQLKRCLNTLKDSNVETEVVVVYFLNHELADSSVDRAQRAEHHSLYLLELIKIINEQSIACGTPKLTIKCWLVSSNAYPLNNTQNPIQSSDINIEAYSALGMGKALALEVPDIWGGMIDVDYDNATDATDTTRTSEITQQILTELEHGEGEDLVKLSHGDRYVLRMAKQSVRLDKDLLNHPSECSYLITGGLGALGLNVAEELAERGVKQLILVSRRGNLLGLDDQSIARIETMRSAGIKVNTCKADVTDLADLKAVIELHHNNPLPIKGVIHAAGISEICPLQQLDETHFKKISRPKIQGAWNLHIATQHLALDHFVLFSSISSVWGSGGLIHYSAGNHFLDGLAQLRKAQGKPALSIHWGPWSEAGMAAGDAKEEAEKRGLRGINPKIATTLLAQLMNGTQTEAIVVDADWNRFKEIIELRKPRPMLSGLGLSRQTTENDGREKSGFIKSLSSKPHEDRVQAIIQYLQILLGSILEKDESDIIDPEAPLMDLGIDSIMALDFKKRLEEEIGETIPATLVFDYPTINAISTHFSLDLFAGEETTTATPISVTSSDEPIAIIGMGSRLPKATNGPKDYWKLLKEGVDAITDVPDHRWDTQRYLDKSADAPGKTYTLAAGLVEHIQEFDAKFFGIAPREMESIEPQQRMVMEASWTAIENAGYAASQLNGSHTGVFVGVGANEYVQNCAAQTSSDDIMYMPTGNAANVIAGRVSFLLGLQGPAMVLDTACSSSAVAIHTACQSLRSGECNLALAGGVNAMILPETFIALSKAQMLSPSGRCKTFDASADGYVRGEGVGVVVLKRLSDAQKEGDNIIAVIKGSAINQDGRSSSLTAPNGPSQQDVINIALRNAGVSAAEVDWIETHGTATPLGDPIEVQSLDAVYGTTRKNNDPLIISAVKTNIGHLESAAGVSSLMKVALSLQHRYIPKHLHFEMFNPHINVDKSHFTIPTDGIDWSSDNKQRYAGVSSFGFSGTNVHMILSDAPARAVKQNQYERTSHVLALSAKSGTSLTALCKEYIDYLETDNLNPHTYPLADIAFTTNTGRDHHNHRLAIVAKDKVQAMNKLKQVVQGINGAKGFDGAKGLNIVGVYTSDSDKPKSNTTAESIAWLFTGQGSQHADMGSDLYETDAAFKSSIDYCDQLLKEETGTPLISLLWGDLKDKIDQTQYTQPAIFCLEYCLAQFWLRVGIKPSVMIGHSVGEYAAAVIAGIFSLEDGIKLIAARGRLMLELTEPGSMAAILTDKENVTALLREFQDSPSSQHMAEDVAIAVANGPKNIVVSGTEEAVSTLSALANAKGFDAKPLRVSHAFHSPMMKPMLAEFRKVATKVQYLEAKLDIISTLTGVANQGEMSQAVYWVDHVESAVEFSKSVQKLEEHKIQVIMEIGPGATLLGLAKQSFSKPVTWIQSQKPKRDGSKQITMALAQLYSKGFKIDWKGFDQPYHRQRIAVPSYCFDRKTYWLGDIREGQSAPASANTTLGTSSGQYLGMISSPMSDDTYFENTFTESSPFNLDDHRLYEAVVAPGAFHISMVLLCAQKIFGDQPTLLDDVVFPEPLVFDDNMKRRLHYGFRKTTETQTTQTKENNSIFEVKGFSREESSDAWVMHTSMSASINPASPTQNQTPTVTPQDIQAIQASATHYVDGKEFYQLMWEAGYQLGSQFQWIDKIWRRPGEALTQLRLPKSEEVSEFLIHPGLMDSCFQSSAMATMHDEMDIGALEAIYIPFAVEKLQFLRPPTSTLWCHVKVTEAQEADAESYSHTIKVFDDQGQLIIDIGTLYSKRAPKDLLLKTLKREPFDEHYETHWLDQEIKEPLSLEAVGQWLVIDDIDPSVGSNLSIVTQMMEEIRSAGGRPLLVKQGSAYRSTAKNGTNESEKRTATTLQFNELNQWTQLIDDLGGNESLKGVLFSSLLDTDLNTLSSSEQILNIQQQLFAGKLNCIKALQLQASTQNPRLWFITKGAMNVAEGDETSGPLSGGISGFAKVLQMEHPELNAVFIDLEPILNKAMQRHISHAILNEMAETGTEKMIALRQAKRFVARLSRCSSAAPKMQIPDKPYRLIIEKKGVFDDLKYVSFDPLPLGSTEVSVKVLRSGLNFRDVMGVLDVYPGEAGPLGGECIGEIIQLGTDVIDLSLGDRVLIPLGMACMSSQMNTESQLITRIPRNLSLNQAATIPVAYTTAMHGLVNLAKLKKGDRVLIHAGAGGVGLAAIYIAKKLGAEIFATASKKKRPYLRSIGVDHVLDSRSLSFADEIKRITGNNGVDVVLNSLAGEFIRTSMGLLNNGGRFIEIGKADIWSQDRVTEFRDDIEYHSFDLVTLTYNDPHLVRRLMEVIVDDLEQGLLKPLPFREFRQSEAIDAFRYMAQGKHIGKILINPDPEPVTIRDKASYLITGAGGGLGLLFAHWLISKGAKELVLVGRKDIRETQESAIKELEAKGAIIRCLQADMGNDKEVSRLFKTIDEASLPLAGVIHAAGVLNDGFIINQDIDSFKKVMSPKLAGAWLLHQHTKDRKLDLFVMFSSLSSLLGAPGQSNYAAANAFLDSLAHYRRSRDLPGMAINWGPWAEVGMAANTTVASSATSGGVHYLKPAEGLEQFERVLALNPIQRGIFSIDWQSLSANFQGEQPAFLSNLNIKVTSGVDAGLQKMADEFRSSLVEVPVDERTSMLMDKICEQLKRVMGLEEDEDIDPQQPLQELGLDSLMAVELRNILCALVGKQLPATLMFKYPTVAMLSEFLIHDIFPENEVDIESESESERETDDTSRNNDNITSEQDLDESLGELSQDELEKMLSDELENL